MRRLYFSFYQSWKMIRCNWLLYLTLYLANLIGLIFPILFFGFSSFVYSGYIDSYVHQPTQTLVGSFSSYNDRSIIKPLLTDVTGIDTSSEYITSYQNIFSDEGFSFGEIVMVDHNYPKFYRIRVGQGRYFTDQELTSGEYVCLLGSEFKKDLFGDKNPLGRFVKIDKYSYKVIGVIQNITMPLRLMIPLNNPQKGDFSKNKTTILLLFTNQIQRDQGAVQLASLVAQNALEVYWAKAEKTIGEGISETTRILILLLIISTTLTLFVILNLGNIIFVLAEEEEKYAAIKRALGVAGLILYVEKFFTIFLVSVLSLLSVLLICCGIIAIIPSLNLSIFSHSWLVFLAPAFLLTITLSAVEVVMLMRRILVKKDVITLVKKG